MPKLGRRHKLAIASLTLYWTVIFILTHIPIPAMIKSAGVRDKYMHFLAYLILTLFLWVAISPFKRVNWLKWQVWLAIALTAGYGGMDEFLQGFVGRGTDLHDFYANMTGVFTCLIILSFLSFWPASLAVSAIFIYILPNFTTGSLFTQHPMLNTGFHFFGFAGFTMIWIQVMDRFLPMREVNFKWPVFATLIPMLFLAAVKITTVLVGKNIWKIDVITAVVGIIIIVAISWPTGICRHKIKQNKENNAVYRW